MENESNMLVKRKGCIKLTRGEWIVKRRAKSGVASISRRRPSDREREANRLREQRRRRVANRIYSGLREHGEFRLPKHPDRNDILIALCEQAGYNVAEDGSVSRKQNSNSDGEASNGAPRNLEQTCFNGNDLSIGYEIDKQPEMEREQLSLDLTISYRYM